MRIVVAITGASGAVYGLRLCEELLAGGHDLDMLISSAGLTVLRTEIGLDWGGSECRMGELLRNHFLVPAERLRFFAEDNLSAPVASGSSAADALVVCPCSMGTVARIAAGISGNLLERCADVMLKERRPVVLAPRETPLSEIHLENMLRLARMGVSIVAAMPAFYHGPRSVNDLVDFVVGKVLDSLGLENRLYRRWGETELE
ncbi:MAG: flavin prenyltransferase UbiX [Geobacteraceae bacterium]|nr:flavin prenyltransferase UbiX [Geobacteraceae bacterium]